MDICCIVMFTNVCAVLRCDVANAIKIGKAMQNESGKHTRSTIIWIKMSGFISSCSSNDNINGDEDNDDAGGDFIIVINIMTQY